MYSHIRQIELDKTWADIWWTMSNGDVSQYNYIRGLEEVEFFTLMEVYKAKHKSRKNGSR
mgnify:CR=1 FL=1